MKVISIWQPWATLLVQGFKVFETRGWAAPKSLIGQRIGIASTKSWHPAQRSAADHVGFQVYFSELGLPHPEELPRGYLLGTVLLDSCELMTAEFMDDVSDEEKSYGWWEEGRYAWRTIDPIPLITPIVIQGRQGIYDWHGKLSDENTEADEGNRGAPGQARPTDIRGRLQII